MSFELLGCEELRHDNSLAMVYTGQDGRGGGDNGRRLTSRGQLPPSRLAMVGRVRRHEGQATDGRDQMVVAEIGDSAKPSRLMHKASNASARLLLLYDNASLFDSARLCLRFATLQFHQSPKAVASSACLLALLCFA